MADAGQDNDFPQRRRDGRPANGRLGTPADRSAALHVILGRLPLTERCRAIINLHTLQINDGLTERFGWDDVPVTSRVNFGLELPDWVAQYENLAIDHERYPITEGEVQDLPPNPTTYSTWAGYQAYIGCTDEDEPVDTGSGEQQIVHAMDVLYASAESIGYRLSAREIASYRTTLVNRYCLFLALAILCPRAAAEELGVGEAADALARAIFATVYVQWQVTTQWLAGIVAFLNGDLDPVTVLCVGVAFGALAKAVLDLIAFWDALARFARMFCKLLYLPIALLHWQVEAVWTAWSGFKGLFVGARWFLRGHAAPMAEAVVHAATPWFAGSVPVNEMAIAGSVFFSAKPCKGVVALMKKHDDTLSYNFVGFGFRTGDCLVTAMHVWEHLGKTGGASCIAPLTGGDKTTINMDRVMELPDDLVNLASEFGDKYACENFEFVYDVFIGDFGTVRGRKFWSQLGVASLPLTDASDRAPVDAFGYFGSEVKRASGQVVTSNQPGLLYYTASTVQGSSGCPVLMGSRCVALHLGSTAAKTNRGLVASVISLVLQKTKGAQETGENVYLDKVEGVFRDKQGRQVRVEREAFGYILIDRTGRQRALALDDIQDYEEIQERLDAGRGYRMEALIKESPVPARLVASFDDDATTPVERPCSPRRQPALLAGLPLRLGDTLSKRLPVPKFSGFDSNVEAVVDMEQAAALGYDSEKYDYPECNHASVAKAMELMIKQFGEANKRSKPPSRDVRRQAMVYLKKAMAVSSYYANPEPLSDSSIASIVESSVVKEQKSPGRAWIEAGMTTIGAVLEKYSTVTLAHMVRALREPRDVHVFPKIEPHKREKLDKGNIRLISGVDLLEMLRCQAYFGEFNAKFSESYMRTPGMIGWSPVKPGDGDYFYNTFRKCKFFFSSDVKAHDWTSYHEWAIEDVIQVIVALAKQPKDMSELEFRDWKVQASDTLRRQFLMPLVLPDGTRYERTSPCIMTSGSVVTLSFNTLMMMYFDTLTKLTMGYSEDDLSRKFVSKFGGDDNIQGSAEEIDVAKYREICYGFGPELHEIETSSHFDGIEFFSWKFSAPNGRPAWVPTRFTKHVQNLKAVKWENLTSALRSHMYNWAHDEPRFRFFESVWQEAHALDSSLALDYKSRSDILDEFAGLERYRA